MPGHFINEVSSCVDESLAGYVRMHNHLELFGRAVISRSPIPSVAVISGNGSGHEPAMVGYVGQGMLSACVSGSIFASPPSSDIFRLILEMERRGAKQILLIILNYTGDRLNFGLALERARELSIDIDMLVIADDAAVENNSVGPRGLAGGLLIVKIACALAEQGKTMSEIVSVCQRIRCQLRTIGLSASGIRAPGQQQAFELMDDEMELGMGIHGESGVQKLKLLPSKQIIDLALNKLCSNTRSFDLKPDTTILLFINNLGGCSNLELGIIVKDAIENLENRKIHVKRTICGEMMTSFNMKGFSITILILEIETSTTLLNLLDSPTEAFSWPKTISPTQPAHSFHKIPDSADCRDSLRKSSFSEYPFILEKNIADAVEQALKTVVKRLYAEVDQLNRLDAVTGDGDTGTSFSRAAAAIERDIIDGKFLFDRPSAIFRRLGYIAESRMGGTCGAICGLLFAAAAKELSLSDRLKSPIESLSDALDAGVQSVESYARVKPGDKSLLDSLIPAIDFVKSKNKQYNFTEHDWRQLAIITERAAQATKHLTAKVGRATYTKSVDITVPDPGASAVAIIIQAISDAFTQTCEQ